MKSAIKPNTDLSLLELCRGETDSALAKILIYPLAELNQCVLNPAYGFVVNVIDVL